MKIAQGLNLRKSLNDQANNLLRAIASYAYEKDAGDNEPNRLVAKYLDIVEKQHNLISSINRTNCSTTIEYNGNKMSLIDARVARDMYIEIAGKLRGLPSKRQNGYAPNIQDIVLDSAMISTVADNFSRQARELDDIIQQTNWNVELL